MTGTNDRQMQQITRRGFLSGTGAAALSFTVVGAGAVAGTQANSRIKAGVIGLGGRGRMIAGMVQKHGGYEIIAVADYFEQVANAAGEQLGVPKANRFSGLSGYKAVIAAGVEAVFLETPPYCFPEHVEAAVEAGRHVYIAKPLGCDVPGCLRIQCRREESDREQASLSVRLPDPHGPVLHRGRQAGARRRDRPDRPAQLRVQRRELPRPAEDRDHREPPAGADLGQRRRPRRQLSRQRGHSRRRRGPVDRGPDADQRHGRIADRPGRPARRLARRLLAHLRIPERHDPESSRRAPQEPLGLPQRLHRPGRRTAGSKPATPRASASSPTTAAGAAATS